MKKIGKFIFTALLAALPLMGWAGEPSLELTVDRTAAAPGEPIVAQVTVSGKATGPQPVLKNTEDFKTRPMGSSSQIQIINGDYHSSKTFQYLLTPGRAGEFTIGPAEITVGGQTYQSGTVTLTIAQGTSPPARLEDAGDRAAFVTAEVSNSRPYVSEQILYTFRFYTRVPIRGTQLQPPDFRGFRKEQLGDVRRSQKVINGQAWEINELQWALTPMTSGSLEIGATELDAGLLLPSSKNPVRDPFFGNDPFFGGVFQQAEQKHFSTEPIAVNVQSLPQEGKPADFSGLVGVAHLSARISAQSAEIGDSVTLTLTVQGSGAIRDLPPPTLEGGGDFKTYDDQPVFKSATGKEGLEGAKTFKKAIVPLKAGAITIPPFSISYFDPKTGRYQSVSTDPIPLHVRPSSHPESISVSNARQPETQKTLTVPSIKAPVLTHGLVKILLAGALTLLILLFVLWTWRKRRARLFSDPTRIRRRKAESAAQKALHQLPEANDREFTERASRILRDYLGNKTGIDAGSLTAADIRPRLEPFGFSPQALEAIRTFLEDCDSVLYGGTPLTPEKRQRFKERIGEIIRALRSS